MQSTAIDYSDVQALTRFAFNGLSEACFFLLRIVDVAAARAWLAQAPVTTAVFAKPPPRTALQVAFSHEGLQALHVSPAVICGFSAEFISGMAGEASRSRRLGDVGPSDPSCWRWGGQGKVPHILVVLYAVPGELDSWKSKITGDDWKSGFSVLDCLSTSNMGGREPFGFVDGISQPELDWQRRKLASGDAHLDYSNVAALGEFLLGYPNEYGKYTDRPLLDPERDPEQQLPPAEDRPDQRDFGHNGTYLVFRDLRQDVRAFWQFIDRQAQSNSDQRQALAEAMVGRKLGSGEPLVPLAARTIAGVGPKQTALNKFTYDIDREGQQCPLAAHIRRANPRNADLPSGVSGVVSRLIRVLAYGSAGPRDDLIASARFHRILRRGREYGTKLTMDEALRPGPLDEDRGLRFICLNANISRQFEFVQNAWLMSAKFNGLTDEPDPLLGNQAKSFSIIRANGSARRIASVPSFVTVTGGAYFFLPSLRAIHYIATAVGT